ncbi:hypothetical protein CHS0354_034310 [Potamilus streckersoni]|uniref:Uncharacterized protein n=1 Tax=Potamilus streckersoni TaxID=2493646 RepID=A0AAE0SHU2_9BIVA|nr:hypothetical protein CHS0354_034310 [Potamilus streckersoni]
MKPWTALVALLLMCSLSEQAGFLKPPIIVRDSDSGLGLTAAIPLFFLLAFLPLFRGDVNRPRRVNATNDNLAYTLNNVYSGINVDSEAFGS